MWFESIQTILHYPLSLHQSSKLILKVGWKVRGSIPPTGAIMFEEIPALMFRLDTNGYNYVYRPNHALANKAGKVYEHVYVMAQSIERKLSVGEVVHHKNRIRTNNAIENLQLMSAEEHTRLHRIEDGYDIREERACLLCKSIFTQYPKITQTYCSPICASIGSRKFNISREELEILVWKFPTVKVAEILGVSDVAVAKRCKKLEIAKPPRGYWRKVETGTL